MLKALVWFTLLCSFAAAKAALDYKAPETTLIFACMAIIDKSFRFGFADDNYWSANCLYPPKVATFTTCFNESGVDFEKALEGFSDMCLAFGGIEVSRRELDNMHLNGTRYLVDPVKENITGVLYNPVEPDMPAVLDYNVAYSSFFNSMNRATDYGDLVNKYWVVVLLTISFFNLIKSMSLNNLLKFKLINKFRSLFTIPTFSKSHLQPFNLGFCETLLPTKQEFYILVVYFGVCIYGASTNYFIYANNPLFGDTLSQWTRFIADRTGILAFTQLPLLFLFGGRNNLLIQISGLQYNTFIIFHKWISRLMFSCALIHGICYSIYAYLRSHLLHAFTQQYWIFGTLALSCCLGIMVQAIYRFRKICYEWFLLIHIVLAFVFIISCIIHCWSFGWLQWCYYSLCFWGFDRLLRIYRLLKFGFPLATVEILSKDDPTLKITIPKPKNYHTYPGCYVFIHFLQLDFKFWESHPFTIFEVNETINIILKPKLGMTLNLFNHLLLQKESKCQLRVAVEGPYGHHVPKKYYQQVMLLAGGNGIPGPFYHALSMVKETTRPSNNNDIESGTSAVKLCWVIRDLESLSWFNKELQMIINKMDIEIYVTREKLPSLSYGSVSKAENDDEGAPNIYQSLVWNSNIKFFNLRPNFEKMLRNEILEKDLKSLSVISCGNPVMCDVIRNNCGQLMDELSGVRVDLFEELQVW